MKIKELEEMLSVSRSNIRFYEKAGLLNPIRKENNYRNYSEQDITELKKILILRKLGFSVEEISAMQKGELSLPDAASQNIDRLEMEITKLTGALEITRTLSEEEISFESMDYEHLWNEINTAEQSGQGFADICKDYLLFELQLFDKMWKYNFGYDFEKSRKKRGIPIACGILLLICILRGIGSVVFWKESFWEGFAYPFLLTIIGTTVSLPLYILSKKAPKVAQVVCLIAFILIIVFFALIAFVIIYSVIRSIISAVF